MSKGTIELDSLTAIANAIRGKLGVQDTYTPGQMPGAIQSIPTGGITPTGTVNIAQNGTHDVTQYAEANVNVPNSYAAGDEGKVVSNGALVAQTSRNIAANGTYDTTTNDEVVVSVAPNLQSKTVTQNGTVTPDQGYDGLSEVVVNVSGGGGGGGILQPVNYDANNGYVNYGKWFKDTSGNYYCDCYEVEANHRYVLCWGARSSSSSQTYAAFFLTNPIEADAFTSGTQIYNSTSVTQYYCINPAYKAPNNGFIVMQKSQAGESGITSYCIDLGLDVS